MRVLWLLWVLCSSTFAYAQVMDIQSEQLSIDHKQQKAVFTGKVHLLRDDFELWSDSLTTFYGAEGGGLKKAIAVGHVRFKREKSHGKADHLVLNQETKILTLTGHAEVSDDTGARLRGKLIIHDMAKGTTEVQSDGQQRVSVHLNDESSLPQIKP